MDYKERFRNILKRLNSSSNRETSYEKSSID
jgi:hypothetical protein